MKDIHGGESVRPSPFMEHLNRISNKTRVRNYFNLFSLARSLSRLKHIMVFVISLTNNHVHLTRNRRDVKFCVWVTFAISPFTQSKKQLTVPIMFSKLKDKGQTLGTLGMNLEPFYYPRTP